MLDAVLRTSEELASEQAVPAWAFGVIGFVVLALLLFVVTRFDPNR